MRGGLLVEFLQQVWDNIKIGKEVQGEMWDAKERRKDEGKDLMQKIQVIHTISGGPTLAGTSNNSRKNHARKIPRLTTGQDVLWVSRSHKSIPALLRSFSLRMMPTTQYNPMMIRWWSRYRLPTARFTASWLILGAVWISYSKERWRSSTWRTLATIAALHLCTVLQGIPWCQWEHTFYWW